MSRYIDLEELEKRIKENIKPDTLEEKALIEWCKDECIRQAYAMPRGDVVVPPCKVGDTVYCIIAKGGLSGGLIYTGHIIKRRVDKLIYDGVRWEMMSDRVFPDYKEENTLIYAYFDDLAFVDEDKANARLEEILDVGRGKERSR